MGGSRVRGDGEVVRGHPQTGGAVGERDRGGHSRRNGDAAARELPVGGAERQAGSEAEHGQARLDDRRVGQRPVRDPGREHAGAEQAPTAELQGPEEGAFFGM